MSSFWQEVALGIALYYAIGVAWLWVGLGPSGWWRNNLRAPIAAIVILTFGAIWPVVLGKIVWSLFSGRKETEVEE